MDQDDMAQRICTLPTCGKPHYGKGYCKLHWRRFTMHGSASWEPPKQAEVCTIDGCAQAAWARDLCTKHYQTWRKRGDPLASPARTKLTCKIDQCGREAHGYGWCRNHWLRWRTYGDPTREQPTYTTCTIDGCSKPPRSPTSDLCDPHYCRRWRNGTLEPGQCEACQEPLPADSIASQRFCATCIVDRKKAQHRDRSHRRRAVINGADAEKIDSREIYERDRWRCGLCRLKVRQSLQWPHPLSASLDHIIPIAAGGLHVRTNVHLAHLICNTTKRDRGGGEQLMLIG